MKRNFIVWAMLVIILAFCWALAGCNNSTTDIEDVWTQLKNTQWEKNSDPKIQFYEYNSSKKIRIFYLVSQTDPDISSVNSNKIEFTNGSFQFKLSGNSITISKWECTFPDWATGEVMNGKYTRIP